MATLITLIHVGVSLGWSGGGGRGGCCGDGGWVIPDAFIHQWPCWPEPSLWDNAAQCSHMDGETGHQPGVFQAPFRSPGS